MPCIRFGERVRVRVWVQVRVRVWVQVRVRVHYHLQVCLPRLQFGVAGVAPTRMDLKRKEEKKQ